MIEIEAPDGTIIEFPAGTPESTILEVMTREYGGPQPQQSPAPLPQQSRAQNVWEGIKSGSTFGFGDEAQAAIAAGSVGAQNLLGMNTGGLTSWQAYNQALESFRGQQQAAQQQDPWAYGAGQIGGGLVTGIQAARALPQATGAMAQYAARGLPQTLATTAGIGAVSGGLYGFGSGEGGAEQRAQSALYSGAAGGVAGPAGALAAKGVSAAVGPLTQKAMAWAQKKQSTRIPPTVTQAGPSQNLNQMVQASQEAQTFEQAVNSKAINQITNALKADYPDNYEQIIEAWRQSDQPLATIAGPALTRKAMGATQYEQALPKTVNYFTEATSDAKDKLLQSVYRNIGDSKSYYATVDDILEKGRKKAKPYYDKAYTEVVDQIELKPEVLNAIKTARQKYPSELNDLPDNSVKVLDLAKRELDDAISAAQRSGENNFARSRTQIVNELTSQIDQVSPNYAKARAISGDYLRVNNALEQGQNFTKLDPQEITTLLKSATKPEKDAYKLGLSKTIAARIDDANEGANPYNRVFGSPTKRNQLKAVLTPEEYTRLEVDMKATNRLFDMRNKVLGNSTTTSKSMAALEISDEEMISAITQPRATFVNFIKNKFTSGNKTASAIADLLYETDPTKKLVLLERVTKNADLTQEEKRIVQEAYFTLDNKAKVLGAALGGQQTASLPNQEQK